MPGRERGGFARAEGAEAGRCLARTGDVARERAAERAHAHLRRSCAARLPFLLAALSIAHAATAGCAATPADPGAVRPFEHPRGELSAGIGRGSAREVETLVADLTYHLPLDRHWSAGARVAAYSFESSESGALDSDFGELEAARTTSGSGAGLGAELRFYPAGAHDGLWIGAGALYFPYSETESVGVAREPATGATFRSELESDAIELVGYGTLGWTLRGAGRSTWSAGLEAGSASGETFASLTLRFGFRF